MPRRGPTLGDPTDFSYRINKVTKIIDGDTIDVILDLGFDILHKSRVRLFGIDTPESRTRDKVEKKFGLASKARLKELMPIGSMQILKTQIDKSGEDKKGKFGRILGDFIIPDDDTLSTTMVTTIMINEGYAVAYHGQNKDEVEQAHLNNRERLIEEGKVKL